MKTSIRVVAGLTLLTTMLPQRALAFGVGSDIVDTAVAAGSFQTLATALTEAGLIETLKQPAPFTVFAPTDAAFARLPKGAWRSCCARRTEISFGRSSPITSFQGATTHRT